MCLLHPAPHYTLWANSREFWYVCPLSDQVTETNLLMVIFVSKELPDGLSQDTCILVSFLIMEGKALVTTYNYKRTNEQAQRLIWKATYPVIHWEVS